MDEMDEKLESCEGRDEKMEAKKERERESWGKEKGNEEEEKREEKWDGEWTKGMGEESRGIISRCVERKKIVVVRGKEKNEKRRGGVRARTSCWEAKHRHFRPLEVSLDNDTQPDDACT